MNSEDQPNSDEPVTPPDTQPVEAAPEPSPFDKAKSASETYVTPEVTEAAPVEPMPAENEPQPQVAEPTSGMVLPPKKSKKKLLVVLGIVVGALLVVVGGAWAAYALWYNAPDNAVNDAFSKALSAKSASTTGTMTIKADGSTVKVDMATAVNESKQSSATMSMTISSSGSEYKLAGNFVGTSDAMYVKMDDLRSVLTGMVGEEYSSLIDDYYGSLLDKIDGKWVVIKATDLESLTDGSISSKESQCVQNEIAKVQTDASVRNELSDVYKKNPLFTVESKGSDSDGNRYSLTPVSNEKAQAFAKAVVETKLFKAIDDCMSDDLKKSFEESSSEATSDSSKATGTFEVWIDGLSHTLNKVAVNVKDDSSELSAELKTKFNNNPSVTVPKGETTFDDLKAEIETLTADMFGASDDTMTYEIPSVTSDL